MKEDKTFQFEIKEFTDEGKFSGYLATFGNVDSGNDTVDPGAFKKTLRENKSFPLNWGHMPKEPDLVIGTFTGKEDETGLLIDGEYFLDLDGGKKAYRTTKALLAKGVKIGLSMGYKTIKDAIEKVEGGFIRHLKEVKLNEGALTLFPMNPLARVLSVKEEEDVEEEITFEEMKPYPNEHACRINDPGKYTRFTRMKRKHNGKEYSVIVGFKKGGGSEDQAYRYAKETWSASEASTHCKEHDGSFEPASKEDKELFCASCGKTLLSKEPDRLERILKDLKESTLEEKPSSVERLAEELK